jgi:hypothetical protein
MVHLHGSWSLVALKHVCKGLAIITRGGVNELAGSLSSLCTIYQSIIKAIIEWMYGVLRSRFMCVCFEGRVRVVEVLVESLVLLNLCARRYHAL